MRHVKQTNALQRNISADDKESRIPLVLTYHPLNNRIKRILLDNFKILSDDPVTKEIFPQPPLVAYRRNENLRDKLLAGSAPCQHRRCQTCDHISSDTNLQGPNFSITIRQSFTCQSSGLVYCISCRRCPAIYIGETGHTLRECFGKHIRSIEKNLPGFPVAEHFNNNDHSLHDAEVTGVKLCGSNKQRKSQEMWLIFQLGSSKPRGLNSDFRFI